MGDDDMDFFYDSSENEKKTSYSGAWKVLIVDDDEGIHRVTKVALEDIVFENKELELIHAYSGVEANDMIEKNPDTSLILLDVVMETDDAGLNVVKYIRETLKNTNVRIILRTGQPGQAPERQVVSDYDINDYKEKSELTVIKLYSAVISSLRSYRDILTINANKVGLEKIIASSSSLFEIRSAETLISGILEQLISIFHLSENSFFCNLSDCSIENENEPLQIIAGTGDYKNFIGKNTGIDNEFDVDILTIVRQAGRNKKHIYHEDKCVLYFKNDDNNESILYVGGCGTLTEWENNLLEIFCVNASIAIRNIKLYDSQIALTKSYSSFVPKDFLTLLGKNSIIDVSLGDQIQKDMTILFSDIRSFTSISENLTPQESFKFLNEYLSLVGPVIRKNNGFIDKYIGDAVMAIFPNNSGDAINAAIAMQKQVNMFNQNKSSNMPTIKIGIGIHFGSLMLGTIGEVERMEGTVISDAVNLASRLESLTKSYDAPILISKEALDEENLQINYNSRFIGRIKVKGKNVPVQAFEVFDTDESSVFEHKKRTKVELEKGIEYFYNKDFGKASEYFIQVHKDYNDDVVASDYLKRSTNYLLNSIPDNWDGSIGCSSLKPKL